MSSPPRDSERLRRKRGSIPSMEALGDDSLKDQSLTIVVVGASGDLASKKTFPALFGLFRRNLLPKDVAIIGYARTDMDDEKFHKKALAHIDTKKYPEESKKFTQILSYIHGPYDKDEGYQKLEAHIDEIENKRPDNEPRNRLFYLAVPPTVFADAAAGLKRNCYSRKGRNRIIIEKPFGKDLETCRELLSSLKGEWSEDETYRIDHYLGKEMVKNLLVLRFGNIVLDATLNKNNVSNVQITFKESFGTEGRGGYFDEFGIIRDVCQNRE